MNEQSIVLEEKFDGPSPDLMSGMEAVMQIIKLLGKGSLTSEPAIKQMASSKLTYECKIIQPYMVGNTCMTFH